MSHLRWQSGKCYKNCNLYYIVWPVEEESIAKFNRDNLHCNPFKHLPDKQVAFLHLSSENILIFCAHYKSNGLHSQCLHQVIFHLLHIAFPFPHL